MGANAITAGAGAMKSAHPPALAAVASMIGTTIEWYDFFLYGTAAALIFNKLFFPNFDPRVGTFASFATYSVGFFARPLGGLVFGHVGDRVGRKPMLLFTLLLMGIPTVLIGLVPGYRQIGAIAPVMLVALRILQGIAVGGEWGGAALLAIEHAPHGRRGFYGSLPQLGVGLGLALSTIAMALTARLPEGDLLDWGWRLPFLASAVLLLVGWFIRIRIAESPAFTELADRGSRERRPLAIVLRDHRAAIVRCLGARLAEVTWFYTVTTFTLAYATGSLGFSRPAVLNAMIAAALLNIVTVPLLGAIGDRVGAKWLYALGAAGVVLFAFRYFALLQTRDAGAMYLAMVPALAVIHALMYGQQGTLLAAQFPAPVRCSAISFAVQVAGAVGGGLAPLIATALLSGADGSTRGISLYLAALGAVGALSALGMRTDGAASA